VTANPYLLPIAKTSIKGAYPIEVSFQKTTHIIFPSRIKDFDAGSDAIIALVPEKVTNVLRVKANLRGFTDETNMTIITEDGGFYSFLVNYNEHPAVFNINIANNLQSDAQTTHQLGINGAKPYTQTTADNNELSQSDLRLFSQRIAAKEGFLFGIGATSHDISLTLTGIYRKQTMTFIQVRFENESELEYEWDFIKVFLKEKNTLKRVASQSEEITPSLVFPEDIHGIRPNTKNSLVFALPIKSLTESKHLSIEIYEKGGGRHLTFEIDDTLLNQAKSI
jgi:conjugative transposon TraN protein